MASTPLEHYAFVGNAATGALIARDGAVDWLCLPRFDDQACFAALLGTREHGTWQIAPAEEVQRVQRQYRPGTAILETTFETASGAATLIDFMPFPEDEHYVELIRLIRGDGGCVRMQTNLCMRFEYGRVIPWVRRHDYGLSAVAGPDALNLHTPVELEGRGFHTVGEFRVGEGAVIPFTLSYHPSHWPARWDESRPAFHHEDYPELLEQTERQWRAWSDHQSFPLPADHRWSQAVKRSLITLKTLTSDATGGIVAAPTTSLPEAPGGVRNWDYRFCWIRDATFTLNALMTSGYRQEARAWRMWLLRAAAGDPRQLQIMYGLRGERRLTEVELDWLPGYEESRPVRIGNAAFDQRQLDVPGELIDVLHVARRFQLEPSDHAWRLQRTILSQLEHDWDKPDEGIWEIRGESRHTTHSRLMCWVAFDRAVKAVEHFGLAGPVDHWRAVRDRIRADIEENGWNAERGCFVQHYGGRYVDASLLLMAEVGFLAPDDDRFRRTVEAVERDLTWDGLVLRYRVEDTPDGLPGTEGVFLACSFWLVDAYIQLARRDDAVALFERLLSLRNDVGLLAEEYDPSAGRQLGNFPQAFSHIALVNTANNLLGAFGPIATRAERSGGAAPVSPDR